jgi:hypothetical protein
VSFASFLLLAGMLILALSGASLPDGSGLMAVLLLLGGMILLTMGALGVYIGIIHKEVKNRPHYIIDQTIGIEPAPDGKPV